MLLPVLPSLCLAGLALAAPRTTLQGPSVKIENGTVLGSTLDGLDTFREIPFAQQPVGPLRLRVPLPINSAYGTFDATKMPDACIPAVPPKPISSDFQQLIRPLGQGVGQQINKLLFTTYEASESCLTLTITRPSGIDASQGKLPVLFWIHGGNYYSGSTHSTDAGSFVKTSTYAGLPVLIVMANYRLGAFGFLGGKEMQRDGSTNLGLLDQRLALQWVAENIGAFGGDPSRVTIWGEHSGGHSVVAHLTINGGDNTYKGSPLFRAAIINSGVHFPVLSASDPSVQMVFASTSREAGCSADADVVDCLRRISVDDFKAAQARAIGSAITPIYLPVEDPNNGFFAVSPDTASRNGDFGRVPVLIGNQEDEGTYSLYALHSDPSWSSVSEDIMNSIAALFGNDLHTYAADTSARSPYRTGPETELFPNYKLWSSFLGDVLFVFPRRMMLSMISRHVPCWTYQSSYLYNKTKFGTFHGTDVVQTYAGLPYQQVTNTTRQYYLNFIYNLDPNIGTRSTTMVDWPVWTIQSKKMLQLNERDNVVMDDAARESLYDQFVAKHQG